MRRPTEAQIAGAMRRFPDGPMATRIGSDAVSLYRCEDNLHNAIRDTVKERIKWMSKEIEAPDFYEHGLPQVLYDLFDAFDEKAVRKAITAWIEDNPETENEGE